MGTTPKKSKNARKDTRKNIIDTARALFSESSYLGVSMNDIAKELDITKAALYYHFAGKEEIYNAVLDEVLNDINAALMDAFKEETLDRQLYKVIKNYLDLGLKEKNIVKATLLSGEKTVRNHVIQNRKQVDGIIQPLFKDILASRQLSGQVDYRLLTSLLVCMMDGIILEYSFSGTKIDFDEIAKQWVVFLFQKSEAEVNSRSLGG
jgi:AcrR family transcriptional regulator